MLATRAQPAKLTFDSSERAPAHACVWPRLCLNLPSHIFFCNCMYIHVAVLQWEPVPLNNAAMCANTCDKDCNFHTTWFSTMHFYFTEYTAVKCPPTYAKTLVITPAQGGGQGLAWARFSQRTLFWGASWFIRQAGARCLAPKKKWSSEPALGFDTPPCAGVLVAMKQGFGFSAP